MYAAFAASAFRTQLAYRGEVWATLFGRLIQVFAKIAIWISVYQGAANVAGVTLPQMVTYAVLGGSVLAAWDYSALIRSIGQSLKTGDVAVFLLKPIRYPLHLLATECGNLGYGIVAGALPTAAIAALVYGVLPPASPLHGALFPVYWLLGFLVVFLVAVLFGLCAFWLMTAFSLDWLLNGILALLAGTFLPFWFFPEPFGAIARHLPFAWIGYYPTAVYIGRLDAAACWTYLGLGLGWAALLAVGVALLWRRAVLRITVQGG